MPNKTGTGAEWMEVPVMKTGLAPNTTIGACPIF